MGGRITRKRYVYFFVGGILYAGLLIALQILFSDLQFPEFIRKEKVTMGILGIVILAPFVVLIAKSVQRCHDLGVSGFYQLIPFFFLFMLFTEGQNCSNKYGTSQLKEKLDKKTLLNNKEESVAINKTAIFKMFLLLLFLLLSVFILILLIRQF